MFDFFLIYFILNKNFIQKWTSKTQTKAFRVSKGVFGCVLGICGRVFSCGIPPHSCFLIYFPTFSAPSPWVPQPHHNTLNRAALADLRPSSFHWPLAWQPRFNGAFLLANTWQVNVWLQCDLMPLAFEVSYCSVTYRTQKRCQVAIVKSYPWREMAMEYNSPYIMRASHKHRCRAVRQLTTGCHLKMLWRKRYILTPGNNTASN